MAVRENIGRSGAQLGYGPDDAVAVPAQYEVPLTGFEIESRSSVVILEPAGTLATGEVVLPDNPIDGQQFRIISTAVVTAFTLTAGEGDTVLAAVAPSTLAANTGLRFVYRLANRTWYRLP